MDIEALTVVVSGLFAVLAAAMGATAAIWVQRRSMRMENEKLAHSARGRVNALSVAVFRDFLRACKDVESLAERRESGDIPANEKISAACSEMWLRLQEVDVFCDDSITKSARSLVDTLQLLVWHRQHTSVSSILISPRAELFAIAGPVFREAE